MAHRLTRFTPILTLLALTASSAGVSLPVRASSITDPTKPPASFQLSTTISGQQGTQEGTMADSLTPAKAPLSVTSLFLMGDNPYALVDGVILRPGDPLAEGKISKIDAQGVWLKVPNEETGGSSLRQIKLLPDISKTMAKPRPQSKPKKQPKPRVKPRTEKAF
jgi:hypothetical protein